MEEIWKPIPGYEGFYEVSNTGKVRSITRTVMKSNGRPQTYIGQMKKLSEVEGYLRVSLYKDDTYKFERVHRLVAMAFLPNPNNYPIVNHKDENKLNNNVDNLEWCTIEYNNNYGTRIKRQVQKQSKPVIMCDKETHEPIKEFLNTHIAAEELGHPDAQSNICKVANGQRKSTLGYWWKYKE